MRKGIERWLETLIETPNVKLTKLDIYQYYKSVEDKLKNFLTEKTIIRQTFEKGKTILRRHPGTKRYITIDKDLKDVSNPKSFDFWIERRATEFHKVFGKKTKELVIDIDPGEKIPFSETKKITRDVCLYIKDKLGVLPKIQYSGGKGFYLILELKKEIPINKARKDLRKFLEPLIETHPKLTFKPKEKDKITLDITILKEKGSYRAPYSLNANTGLVSIFVPFSSLLKFKPERDANPKKMIRREFIPERLIE